MKRVFEKTIREALTDEDKQIGSIDIDIAVDSDDKEAWREFCSIMDDYGLEETIIEKNGPAGGWPFVNIKGPRCSIHSWCSDHYANDEEELAFVMKNFQTE